MKPSRIVSTIRSVLTVSLFCTFNLAVLPQASPEPRWTPPTSRTTALTLFAPRPLGGDNIFKGEAEQWLADAIERLETGTLVPLKDQFVLDYVSQVGNYLASHSVAPTKHYQFSLLGDEEKNAMSLGGGRIYINRGLLKAVESEDELAGVLAHEIAHDAFGHAPKTVTRQLFWMKGIRKVKTPAEVETALQELLATYQRRPVAMLAEAFVGFARFSELEADRAAFYNVYKAGYNPHALSVVLKRLEREVKEELGKSYGAYQFLTLLFGSHPPTAQRALALGWEANFVKMPARETRVESRAFELMKTKVAKL